MEIVNRELVCTDCGNSFIFSAGEQLFFKEKNFVNDPKRCKLCKAKRAAENSRALPESQVQCEECGVLTTVPFRPSQGRPVYCRACFQVQPKRPVVPRPEVVARGLNNNNATPGGHREVRSVDHSHAGNAGAIMSENVTAEKFMEMGTSKGIVPAPLRMVVRDKGPVRAFAPIGESVQDSTDGGMRLLRTS